MFSLLLLLCMPAPAAPAPQSLVELRRDLHRHPELGNRETRTMARIAEFLKGLGVAEVRAGAAKTGVVARIKGGRPGPTVALRAPIDAYPIQEKTETSYKSTIPGVSHACGHDAITASVLGAAASLQAGRESLPGDVLLLFQPAEEGGPEGEEAGAPLLLKEGALKGVSAILTFHGDETLAPGQAAVHEQAVYAGADTIDLTVTGTAAHGATPWKGVDALAVAAQIVSGFQLVVSRQTDAWAPVVVTLGTVAGGTRPNGTAGEVRLTGTLRSYSAEARAKAQESLRRIAEHVALAFGAKAALAFKEGIPPVVNDARLVKELRPVLETSLGAANVRTFKPMSFADDFSVLSEKVPSFYFQLGVGKADGSSPGSHTETYDVDEAAIPLGASLLDALARKALTLDLRSKP